MGPPKPLFTDQLRVALNAEMGIKIPKSDRKIAKHPFLLLGYGVNSYFEIMEQMMKMFCVISLFFIPVMGIYVHNN